MSVPNGPSPILNPPPGYPTPGFGAGAALAGSADSSCGGGSGGLGGCAPGGGGEWAVPGPDAGGQQSAARCGCVDGETQVSLLDGSTVRAEDLSAGDKILGVTENGCPAEQIVTRVYKWTEARLRLETQAGVLICSVSHPLATVSRGFVATGSLHVTDRLLSEGGDEIAINEITPMDPGVVFGLECSPDHTYVTAGLISHNKGYPDPFFFIW